MAYGLPMQLSGAVGRTKHNKKPFGLGLFLVLVSCCIREHRRFRDCPAEVAWSQKRNFARLGPERTYLLVSVGFIRFGPDEM